MLAILTARLQVPCTLAGIVLLGTLALHHDYWLGGLGLALIIVGWALTFRRPKLAEREPFRVHSPVRGRWIAVNSPADKVPSHGVHSAGQTYAIDLLHWPDADVEWKALRAWPPTQRPSAFPGFGQPIYAPADGTVVGTRDWWRDHGSRNSWPAYAYFLIEGTLRELAGPSALLGNYVVLDLGDGTFAALAHLKRKSIVVESGQRVTAGQRVGDCGNSGNTSEPHLHFQLMDDANVAVAAGLPFSFAGHDIPRTGEPLAE